MDDPIIFSNVNKSYETPPVFVVHDFSVRIHEGEFFCLVGPSGCGKSTVLKLIADIVQPTSGVLVKPHHVGMVFQSYALLPWLTVQDNVAFVLRMRDMPADEVERVTDKYLKMVHLEAFRKKFPRELSGGQRQRVGLARALAIEVDTLLMDEPFSALDPVITDELLDDLLQIWQGTRKTIVMVSHHFEEAVTLADRIGVMKDGMLDQIITVSLPRPRVKESPAFLATVKHVHESLTGAVNDRDPDSSAGR